MGAFHTGIWYLPETNKSTKKMTDLIPYFAGLITLIFGVGFYNAIKSSDNFELKDKK
jgi:hypothetical protein